MCGFAAAMPVKGENMEDVAKMKPEHPSAFYSLVEGAAEAVLLYPADGDSGGPFWNEQGELDLVRGKDWDEEEAGIVPLGGNRYRLAERLMGPFSGLRLFWGDEFTADPTDEGALRVTSVVVPRRYVHFRFLASKFNNDHPLAIHLHAMSGGWETVAKGMLTLTVPAEHGAEFQRLMYQEGLAPGVITLVL
jgi:hypothetical protein